MKNSFYTNKVRTFLLVICITIILIALVSIPVLTAHASYSGSSSGMTREQIHTATLSTSVKSDTPAITVFMHGLGGSAKDWSNNFNGTKGSRTAFVKDSDSLMEKMRESSTGLKLYRAKTYSNNSFSLYSEYSETEVTKINDFSNHTIIVVEISSTRSENIEENYARLHNVIDKISYDYYAIKGRLPRINLIGHSMGGLLNMQYAIEHPKNVASLVSLGTPYIGSFYDNPIVELAGISEFNDQPCMAGTCGHNYYFCNLDTRRDTWNSVYSQNTHIKFLALSGETSFTLMDHIVWTNNYLEDYVGAGAAVGIRTAFVVIPQLNFDVGFLPGDICVDTDSQKAVGYNGVINYNKVFTSSNCNVNKRSQDNFPVPHNLEVYDKDMQACILKFVDYGNNTDNESYIHNGIRTRIIAKTEGKWLIELTNNTGSKRSFEYNQRMCFYSDAQNWSGLGHIQSTDVLANGASTILEISEFGTATSIVISYDNAATRYIFYADELNRTMCTMSARGSTKSYYCYYQNNIKVGILSKYEGQWIIKLTNNTGSTRSFYYNKMMCFAGDAQNWKGLYNVAKTKALKNGESTILFISEYLAATDIVISYTNGGTRYIFYADNLNTSGTMKSYSSNKPFYTYTQSGIKASIIGKNTGTWLIELTNNTGSNRSFDYNQRMCFESDAKNWNGLSHVATTLNIHNGESYIIEISEYGTATSIAISYTEGNTRKIFYAKNLSMSGTMTSYYNSTTTYSYQQHGIKVGIVGKNGGTWQIKLTNNTGSAQSFYYNKRMCFAGDAQNWAGLSDIGQTDVIANGESVTIEIAEYGTTTSIAISYINGSTRYIHYAYNLSTSGTLSSFASTKSYKSYTQNGITVSIVGKNGGTWMIDLTNNTGNDRVFEYNRRMCFAGDAEKGSGLSHVSKISLQNGKSTTYPLEITEYGTATSIAISYMDGIYRKVFYAYNLDKSGTMSAYGNTIDTTAPPPNECLSAGSLITLADGSQKAVEELTGNEMLLVWNLKTGTYDTAPILFIDNELIGHYEVIKLNFSDDTVVNVISEHGFWDVELNKYVYLDENAAEYIGHCFLKYDGNGMTEVTLTDVEIITEVTTAWSPVTYGHLCYFVDGMLSMPGGIDGLFNIFEVDSETLTYNTEAMNADIEEYGLFTYEEFYEMYPVSEEVFDAFNGEYLKVAIGKGLITYERIGELIERYAEFF